MGQKTKFWEHVSAIAKRDYFEWARGHMAASAAALLLAALGVPGAMLIGNNSLWGEVVTLLAYGVVSPIALLFLGYGFFYIRAFKKAYDEHTAEIRDLRTKLGIPTDDLEPRKKSQSIKVSWLNIAMLGGAIVLTVASYYLLSKTNAQAAHINATIGTQTKKLDYVERHSNEAMKFCGSVKRELQNSYETNKKAEKALRQCFNDLDAARHNQLPQDTARKTPP